MMQPEIIYYRENLRKHFGEKDLKIQEKELNKLKKNWVDSVVFKTSGETGTASQVVIRVKEEDESKHNSFAEYTQVADALSIESALVNNFEELNPRIAATNERSSKKEKDKSERRREKNRESNENSMTETIENLRGKAGMEDPPDVEFDS